MWAPGFRGVVLGEDPVAGHGNRANHENPDEPDKDGDEGRDGVEQCLAAEDLVSETLMADQSQGYGPPGEGGVHCRRKEPGADQVPGFGWLAIARLGRENPGDPGEVHAA